MHIEISTNATDLARALGQLKAREIPWASAKALTELAFDGMRAAKSELAASMDLRNRFSAGGIQVNRAEKRDWPELKAEVGIERRRSYLIDHVTGGTRHGGRNGRAILEEEGFRGSSGRIAKSKRPGPLIARGQRKGRVGRKPGSKNGTHSTPLPFLIFSSKWGNEVLVQRTGHERYPLQILYAFKRTVSIKPEFDMAGSVFENVQGRYSQVFGRELGKAIAQAKSRAERRASSSRGVVIEDGR